jgi:hypothetical protein
MYFRPAESYFLEQPRVGFEAVANFMDYLFTLTYESGCRFDAPSYNPVL